MSICYWNLNSIITCNHKNINLLAAYNTINKSDMICICESYLDSSTFFDKEQLNIEGYNSVKDYFSGVGGSDGVCIHFTFCIEFTVEQIPIF